MRGHPLGIIIELWQIIKINNETSFKFEKTLGIRILLRAMFGTLTIACRNYVDHFNVLIDHFMTYERERERDHQAQPQYV